MGKISRNILRISSNLDIKIQVSLNYSRKGSARRALYDYRYSNNQKIGLSLQTYQYLIFEYRGVNLNNENVNCRACFDPEKLYHLKCRLREYMMWAKERYEEGDMFKYERDAETGAMIDRVANPEYIKWAHFALYDNFNSPFVLRTTSFPIEGGGFSDGVCFYIGDMANETFIPVERFNYIYRTIRRIDLLLHSQLLTNIAYMYENLSITTPTSLMTNFNTQAFSLRGG